MTRKFTRLIAVVLHTVQWSCEPGIQKSSNKIAELNCSNLQTDDQGFIQLSSPQELGQKLIISGKVIDADSKLGIPATIFFFQTDSTGIYNTLGLPQFARIRGKMQTNVTGCYKLSTILPGDYPGTKGNRHIHLRVGADGYETINSVFYFNQFVNDQIRKAESGIFFDIKKERDEWIGSADIILKKKS